MARLSIIVATACLLLLLLEWCIIPIVAAAAHVVISDDDHDNDDDGDEDGEGYARLVSWIVKHGGRVDSRIACNSNYVDKIGEERGGRQPPRRGMFAIADICSSSEDGSSNGTDEEIELLFVPWKLVIGGRFGRMDYTTTPGSPTTTVVEREELMCDVIHTLAKEIQRGERSDWYPYIDYLGRLPHLVANWTNVALVELQGLAPQYDASRHLHWFDARCSQSNLRRYQGNQDMMSNNHQYKDDDININNNIDEDAINSSLIAFISRASEVGMIPIYDLINHHNGKRNVKLRPTNNGVHLVVFSSSTLDGNINTTTNNVIIKQGQELYLSYGIKIASTMYRDYGFVESWPTCWNFMDVISGDNYAFVSFDTTSSIPPPPSVNGDGGEGGIIVISAINPTEDYLRNMWNTGGIISQEEYEFLAIKHTETLSILELQRFVDAAHVRYNDFPSTINEDNSLLVDIRHRQQQQQRDETAMPMPNGGGDDDGRSTSDIAESRTNDEDDIVSAIQYRIAFKSALVGSAIFAESIIANKVNRELDDNKNVEL